MDLLDKFHIDQMNYDHQNIKPAMTILSNRVGIKNRKLKASLLLTLFLGECCWYRDILSPNTDWRIGQFLCQLWKQEFTPIK